MNKDHRAKSVIYKKQLSEIAIEIAIDYEFY